MLGLLVRIQTLGWGLRSRLRRADGQTSSEYLVIAGILVAILIAILTVFRTQITSAFNTFTGKVTNSLTSSS